MVSVLSALFLCLCGWFVDSGHTLVLSLLLPLLVDLVDDEEDEQQDEDEDDHTDGGDDLLVHSFVLVLLGWVLHQPHYKDKVKISQSVSNCKDNQLSVK